MTLPRQEVHWKYLGVTYKRYKHRQVENSTYQQRVQIQIVLLNTPKLFQVKMYILREKHVTYQVSTFQSTKKKDRPSARSSHTRWGPERDYKR